MTIGVIGVGRLGTALIKGFINGGVKTGDIYVYDISLEALRYVEALGVTPCRNVDDVVRSSDIVIVAVKPHDVVNVVRGIASMLSEDQALVSVAAFVPLKALEKYISRGKIYRAMPNIAVEVNRGFTALTPLNRRDSKVEAVFKILGETVWVSEDVLDLLTIVSASTPAIVAELMDAFILMALKAGVPYDIAKKAIAMIFQGVGKLVETKDISSIRDSVITPRGTTIILVEKLYTYEAKNRLLKALVDSVEEYLAKLEAYRRTIEQ